jgi:hypothetical protein
MRQKLRQEARRPPAGQHAWGAAPRERRGDLLGAEPGPGPGRPRRAAVQRALWASRFVQGRTADAYRTATRALSLADPGSKLSSQAHHAVGGSAASLGRPAEGLRHLELSADLAGSAVWLITGIRVDIHSRAWAAHVHWLLSHETEARSACRQAIKLARSIDHPFCLTVTLAYGCVTHQLRHDLPALRDAAGELRELCDRYGFAYYREWALVLDGWSRTGEQGIGLAQQSIASLKAEGAYARMPYWLSLLAHLLANDDRPGAARDTLDAALAAAASRWSTRPWAGT